MDGSPTPLTRRKHSDDLPVSSLREPVPVSLPSCILRILALACLSFFFLCPALAVAQWSTSSLAESTLYVCPGIFPGIFSERDGSSTIIGVLQSYIFAGKLDPFGFASWPSPVLVFHNDSSFITESPPTTEQDWGGVITDGQAGLIVAWYDHRGANRDSESGRWMNNGLYAQHVDRDGIVQWNPAGGVIAGPQRGLIEAKIIADRTGGFICIWTEDGFKHPNIPDKYYIRAARFDSLFVRSWEVILDSSMVDSDVFTLYRVIPWGSRIYLDYYAGTNRACILTFDGSILTPNPPVAWTIATSGDSVVFVTEYPNISRTSKIGPLGDTLWSVTIQLPDSCMDNGWYLVPDGGGGTYLRGLCGDTLVHIDCYGSISRNVFLGSRMQGGAYSDGNQGLVLVKANTAMRYDSSGTRLWPAPVLYLTNPNDTYFTRRVTDNNGGVISTFWTTIGGIYAQHTGRTGVTGVISSVPLDTIAHRFWISQNYPNPFNGTTSILVSFDREVAVTVEVFDMLGRRILADVSEKYPIGRHRIDFDASLWPSGVYFCRLIINGNPLPPVKMLVLR
jgi:hypothetical protein